MVKSVKSMVDVELLVVYADAQLRNSGGTTFYRGFHHRKMMRDGASCCGIESQFWWFQPL